MYRFEIVSNRSVKDDIVEGLERALPGILYTVIPQAEGRGKNDRKLGTTTWPELNFILFAYVADGDLGSAKGVIAEVKRRFPNEGIACFTVKTEEA